MDAQSAYSLDVAIPQLQNIFYYCGTSMHATLLPFFETLMHALEKMEDYRCFKCGRFGHWRAKGNINDSNSMISSASARIKEIGGSPKQAAARVVLLHLFNLRKTWSHRPPRLREPDWSDYFERPDEELAAIYELATEPDIDREEDPPRILRTRVSSESIFPTSTLLYSNQNNMAPFKPWHPLRGNPGRLSVDIIWEIWQRRLSQCWM